MESVCYICLMKNYLLFILLFTSFFCTSAQGLSKDTLTFQNLDYKEMNLWDSIERKWYQNHFNLFLKKNKIKISCGGCSRFIMDVYFEIHEDGHCHPKLILAQKCYAELTAKQRIELLKLLMLIEFPEPFYNRNYRFKMGRALKC